MTCKTFIQNCVAKQENKLSSLLLYNTKMIELNINDRSHVTEYAVYSFALTNWKFMQCSWWLRSLNKKGKNKTIFSFFLNLPQRALWITTEFSSQCVKNTYIFFLWKFQYMLLYSQCSGKLNRNMWLWAALLLHTRLRDVSTVIPAALKAAILFWISVTFTWRTEQWLTDS